MQTAVGVAGLLGFVLATSVDARQPPPQDPTPAYACDQPYPVVGSPAQVGFGAHGGYWSANPPADAVEASCTWSADGQEIPATLEHYLARPDGYYDYPGWTWISSGPALDSTFTWSLRCEWLPAGCTPETCADTRQMIELPAAPIFTPRDPAVEISYVDPVLEVRSCTGLGVRLRLQLSQAFDLGFWQDGGVLRIGYADGTYFMTTPGMIDDTVMTLVPPPVQGETWFGVEVVRGDGVVLDATRFDLTPAFWDSVVVVDPYYNPAYIEPNDKSYAPPRQGCHRAG